MVKNKRRKLNKEHIECVFGLGLIVAEIIAGVIIMSITDSSTQSNSIASEQNISTTTTCITTTTTVETTTTIVTAAPKTYYVPYDTVNEYVQKI